MNYLLDTCVVSEIVKRQGIAVGRSCADSANGVACGGGHCPLKACLMFP